MGARPGPLGRRALDPGGRDQPRDHGARVGPGRHVQRRRGPRAGPGRDPAGPRVDRGGVGPGRRDRHRIRPASPSQVDYSLFDGLVSDIGVLTALERDGAEAAVDRLTALATPDGWPQTHAGPPGYLPDARINDVTLGTAGVLLGALWARRFDVEGATRLAEHAVDVLLAEAEPTPAGTNWSFVPPRF